MTMTNAEWCIKNGYKLRDIDASRKDDSNWEFEFKILASDHLYRKIGQLKTYNSMYPSEALLEWLDMEHDESVLNDAEKQYLRAVIEPFKYRFLCAGKIVTNSGEYEHIVIDVKSIVPKAGYGTIELPLFKTGEMYKGMEPDKAYSLEELGLYE